MVGGGPAVVGSHGRCRRHRRHQTTFFLFFFVFYSFYSLLIVFNIKKSKYLLNSPRSRKQKQEQLPSDLFLNDSALNCWCWCRMLLCRG